MNEPNKSHPADKVIEKRRRVEAALRANSGKSSRELAKELGVSPDTVDRTRRALQAGNFTLRDARQVSVPEGAVLSELVATGIGLEEDGMSPPQAAKRVQLSMQAYSAARDIYQLAANYRLRGADLERAQAAVAKMDASLRPSVAYEDVRDLILKMWGGQLHSPHNAIRRERIVEDYMHAVIVFAEGAQRIGALDVPFLSDEERTRARAELQRAKTAVDDAIKHLRGEG